MWEQLTILVLLTLANGVFAGAELAVLSLRKTRIQELVDGGSRRALAVRALRAAPERFLATVQIGITVVGASAAAFGGASLPHEISPALERLGLSPEGAERLAFVGVVAFVSYLSLVLGELVPKSLALKFSEGYALGVSGPLQGLSAVMRPLVWLLTESSNLVLRLFGDRTTFTESRISPEELQGLVEEAARSGTLHPQAGEIASRAFDLGELWVSDVMVPRSQMVALSLRADAEEVKRVLLEEGHSRMPVYDGRLDNIVGYVIAKDLLALVWEKALIVLDDAVRPVYFIPETKRAVEALKELQRRRSQLGVVVDELGTVVGLVTIEDLVEEVVGDIFSEHEQPVETVHPEPGGAFLVQGTAAVRDVNRRLEGTLELPEAESYSTVAGLVLTLLGRIPEPGTRLSLPLGGTLEVVDASPRRVRQVRLHPAGLEPSP